MRPDPAQSSSSFDRRSGRVSRLARAIVLLIGFAGCGGVESGGGVLDLAAKCLEEHPGFAGCCFPDEHVDHGTCCPDGSHALADVEHADWRICVPDADPADADADAPPDADADAK